MQGMIDEVKELNYSIEEDGNIVSKYASFSHFESGRMDRYHNLLL